MTKNGQHTCVKSQVHLQAPLRGEELVALLALVVLHARVRFDVRRQRGLDGKGAEALRAFVGFLVRVDADVSHQVAGLLELLAAVGALMPPHPIHLQSPHARRNDKDCSVLTSLRLTMTFTP